MQSYYERLVVMSEDIDKSASSEEVLKPGGEHLAHQSKLSARAPPFHAGGGIVRGAKSATVPGSAPSSGGNSRFRV